MYDDNYLEFVKWGIDNELEPLTRTQYLFATFLIHNHEHINKIGDLEYVFEKVRQWLKTNPLFWKEHFAPEEIIIKEPPANFSGESVAFNWALPMKDIEFKFKNKKPVDEINEPKSLIDIERELYKKPVTTKPPNPNPPPITDDVIFIGRKKTKYHRVATLTKILNSKPIGTPVYYNHINDDYAIETLTKDNFVRYNYSSIKDRIEFNGEMPNGKPIKEPFTFIDKMIPTVNLPTPNFHEDYIENLSL